MIMAPLDFLIAFAVFVILLSTIRRISAPKGKDAAIREVEGQSEEPEVKYLRGFFSPVVDEWRTRLAGFSYLVSGPQLIEKAYTNAKGKPFVVQTPSNKHLMITSNSLIDEVLKSPSGVLSLHAVAKELLQPRYTMAGFEWQDQRGLEGTGFVRALRSLLTSHLPVFRPQIESIIQACLEKELHAPKDEDWTRVKLFPMVKRIVTQVNCHVFFGEELSKNTEFTTAALDFPQAIVLAAECLRITPSFLCPLVASIATRRHRAAKTLFHYLKPLVQQRLADRAADKPTKNVDIMQWLIDTSPRKDPWSPARMIGEIMAVWFSTVHQLAMTATYVIEDLCLHHEYIEPLRQEMQSATTGSDGLPPLLDSFVKESVRCSNADAISCRRKALQAYMFKDGSRMNKDDWVCIPQRAMMADPSRYADPTKFDGFRFVKANHLLQAGQASKDVPDSLPSTFTTATPEWPIWGLGKTACPGRFYASLVLKTIVSQILNEWDFIMPDTKSPRTLTWRSSVVPRDDTVVMFRKKAKVVYLDSIVTSAQD